jgi:hypothetical protein
MVMSSYFKRRVYKGLASEEFLPPLIKFNDIVGPLFAALAKRFPLDEHTESGLSRSLGVFLNFCFVEAVEHLIQLRPAPLVKEEWMTASEETKQVHLKWQSNLIYLKSRNVHFMKLLAPNYLRQQD